MKSFNTLHFRSLQGKNDYFSNGSTETKVLPQSVSSFLDCDYANDMSRKTRVPPCTDNDIASEIKKRRRGRYLLDQLIHSSFFFKLFLCRLKTKTWTLARLVVVALVLGVAIRLSAVIVSESSPATGKHGENESRLLPPKKPRILQFLDPNNENKVITNTTLMYILPKTRRQQIARQQATDWFYFHEEPRTKEEMDRFIRSEPFETEHCKAMYEWQKSSFPTCNMIHENQIQEYDIVEKKIQKINYGFFRDIWKVQISTAESKTGQYVVLKTLRTDKEYDEYNADRHRRDAVALERLTSSPHVVNIYGHCVNSQMTEYSGEGDVYDAVFYPKHGSTLSKEDALRIAIQVATGIADMHNLEKDGQAPMAHTDIAPTQFILIDGYYKLNDFNRVRFIRWNNETNVPCPYQVMNNPGEFRSPEEYEYGDQTEKVDIYSMGNVFYVLLTATWPWDGTKEEEAQKLVKEGKRPYVNATILNSTNAIDQALLTAMDMCYVHDPSKRASAKEVLNFLIRIKNNVTNT